MGVMVSDRSRQQPSVFWEFSLRYLFPKISYFTLTLLLSLYFTFVVNLPILLHFYRILHALPAYNLAFALTIPVVLFFALNFVFTPFSFRPLLKPFFMIILPVSALASFAMMTYQVVFDRGMIENILETQSAEATSYLNVQVVLWFVFRRATGNFAVPHAGQL